MTTKAEVFSFLRSITPDKKLTQDQVTHGDKIMDTLGLDVFAKSIGYPYTNYQKTVTGQFDIGVNGYAIIKKWEGVNSKAATSAYKDTGGVWTIGYGTIKYPNGNAVKQGDTCTEDQAETYLKHDSEWVDKCLDKTVKVKVNQNQFDALASLVYNIGETSFTKSTLLSKLNAGDFATAANEFLKWKYDNGKEIQGLLNRRNDEKKLFLTKV